MHKVLKKTQSTGDPFDDVPAQFSIIILNPSGNTFPSGTYLEYAVKWVDGAEVADADLIWQRRSTAEFKDDSGATQGATLQFFNHIDGCIYRMVTGTAGIEAVVGMVQ